MRLSFPLILAALTLSVPSQADGTFARLSIGHTELDISSNFESKPESLGTAGIGLNLGYVFESQLVAEIGISRSQNFSLFGASDKYTLRHTELLVGYKLNWDKLSFTPKIGYANWNLDAKEGQLFNPGDEDSRNRSGNDFVWGASLGYQVGSRFELSLSHKRMDTDVGEYGITAFGVAMEF
jgi:hypothetical protein